MKSRADPKRSRDRSAAHGQARLAALLQAYWRLASNDTDAAERRHLRLAYDRASQTEDQPR
jgi:hypothetical protein